LDDIDESGRIVIGNQLTLIHFGYELRINDRTTGTQDGDVVSAKYANLGQRLGGQDLDLEHGVEPIDVSKERRHVVG
jgi:hypothetical protein